MKSFAKLFGLIVLVAVIGLSMGGCGFLFDYNNQDDNDGDGGGSWTGGTGGTGGNGGTGGTGGSGGVGSTVDNAISVTVGYSSSHTINQNGKQWFSFVGTGGTIIFETTGNVVYTEMRIWNNHDYAKSEYSSLGVVGSDDNSGEGQNALVTLNTTTLGVIYYIRITSQSSTSGTYTFLVKFPVVNSRTDPILVTDGYSSSHTINSNGQHWFRFQGTGEMVTFETESKVVTVKIEVYIGDNTNTTSIETNKISFITVSGTTYYFKITGNSGTYTFKAYNEVGNGSSVSYTIPVTVGYSSSHTISQNGKQWFSFVGTGGTIIFETTGNVVYTEMRIWNNHDYAKSEYSSLGVVGSDDNSGEGQNALVTLNTTSGVIYYIRITSQSSTSGTYTFLVKFPMVNSRTDPILVTDGYSSPHTINSNGQHWFCFQGTGEMVTFEIEGKVVTGKIEIYIGDNTSSTFTETNKISFITVSGTTYYFKITGNSGTYTFNAYNAIGDGSSVSYTIPVMVGYSSSHTISQNGKQWFSFAGTGGTVIFETTGNVVYTEMRIWNNHDYAKSEYSSLGVVGSDDNSGEGQNAKISLNTTSGVTYFIRIIAQSSTSGSYMFVVK